ncbi:MAG: insulinase family protein [Sulfobacillus thermosulfidooxidans]|nr:MAG: insulinase family protein [Sulfobacillus thermosulfidooxidans]
MTPLSSGLTLAWDDYGSLGTTAIAFYVHVGSRDENPELFGAAHFLEHAVFKGARSWSARDIANIQDRLGGEINAFTTRDYTVFYAKVLASKAADALELLWAMVSEPWLREDDIGKERQVILEELLEAEDDLEDRATELYMAALYPDEQFHHDILGSRRSLRQLNAEQLKNFHRKFYHPDNITLVLSGEGVEELKVLAESLRWPHPLGPSITPVRLGPKIGPHIEILSRPGEQVHVTMGVPAPRMFDADHDAALVLSTILGGQNSSRLWQRLREDEGLVYTVSASYSAMKDWGELSIYMAMSPQSVPQALEAATQEVMNLLEYGPTEEERAWALTQAETAMAFTMETPDGRMARLGAYAVYGASPLDPKARLSRLEQVSCEQIMRVSREILAVRPWAVAACGPVQGLERVLQTALHA